MAQLGKEVTVGVVEDSDLPKQLEQLGQGGKHAILPFLLSGGLYRWRSAVVLRVQLRGERPGRATQRRAR